MIIGALAFYTVTPLLHGGLEFFNPEGDQSILFQILGWVVAIIVIGAILGFLGLLFIRRDAGVAYVIAGGAICGVVSALISAPIAAYVFGGVTGSGTDLLVAAFQQAGSDLITAVTQQGLLSDPIDKTITFFVVVLDPPDVVPAVRRTLPAGREGSRPGAGVALSPSAGVDPRRRSEPADLERSRRLVPPTPSPYHRLNPLTKAVIATVGSIGAFAWAGIPDRSRSRSSWSCWPRVPVCSVG